MQEVHPPTSEDWQDWGKLLLEGLNRLLKSVYRRDVWLSQLLRESGVDRDPIAKWRGDKVWLMEFCENISQGLMDALQERYPSYQCKVLMRSYVDRWPLERTSAEYSMSVRQIMRVNTELMDYLRSRKGKETLKDIVLQAALSPTAKDEKSAKVSLSSSSLLRGSQFRCGDRVLVGQVRKSGEIVVYDPKMQQGSKAAEVYLYRMRYGGMASFGTKAIRQIRTIENEKVKQYALRAYLQWKRKTRGRFRLIEPKKPGLERVVDCWNCTARLETKRHPTCEKCGWIRCPLCGACGCGYERD